MRLLTTITSFIIVSIAAFGPVAPGKSTLPETVVKPAIERRAPSDHMMDSGVRITGQELDEAMAQYTAAGLPEPIVEVHRFPTNEECYGNFGYHIRHEEYSEIRLCNHNPNTLAHELAHAWIAQHTTKAQRTAYMSLRGFESWNDSEVDWHDRGTEDAAFVFQAILRTENVPQGSPEWQSRLAGFRLLTGAVSPQGPCPVMNADRALDPCRR